MNEVEADCPVQKRPDNLLIWLMFVTHVWPLDICVLLAVL